MSHSTSTRSLRDPRSSLDRSSGGVGYDASRHAWVSKEVLGGTQQPRLVTLRPPESISEESDSGWTIGNGDEPNARPDAFEWSPMGWLSDRFPELELVFRTGRGNWYRDPEAHQYLRA
jgi:hypothetical protein